MPEIHGAKIAVGGKGGVGKTTVSAILAQLFAEAGYDVLAIEPRTVDQDEGADS